MPTRPMNIGIFSNLTALEHGGGGVFIYAIAQALSVDHRVTLHHPGEMSAEAVTRNLPGFVDSAGFRVESTPPTSGWRAELRRAWRDRKYDAVLVQTPMIPRLSFAKRSFWLCEFPYRPKPTWRERVRMGSYRHVLANSRYTAHWIEQYLGRQAEVLHPPVDMIEPEEKQPWILSVGRFLGGGRSKCQLEMVEVFRRLCEQRIGEQRIGGQGAADWQLHLAGYRQNPRYADEVVEAAAGLPVEFHFDLDREQLEHLYARSSIYWHATGLDVDVAAEPGRVEHFGISSVEAMSAGCVPVLIDRGGQTEIIGDSEAGFLWSDRECWIDSTRALIEDPSLRAAMSKRARRAALAFSYPRFRERVGHLITGSAVAPRSEAS